MNIKTRPEIIRVVEITPTATTVRLALVDSATA
jgi:hypothetical protein